MNRYDLTLCRIDGENPMKRYYSTIYGNTINEAIDISNYWAKPNELIGIDYAIVRCEERKLKHEFDLHEMKKLMNEAISNKIESIQKILKANMDDEDKEGMIKCVVNESPYMLYELDTICRDRFMEIMKD